MTENGQKLSVIEKTGYSLGDLAANLVFQTLVGMDSLLLFKYLRVKSPNMHPC